MLTGELIQRIQSLYSRGVKSDESRLSSRHIYNICLSVRSLLITQKVNKKQKISSWSYVTLPCVELIKVNPQDCPCLPNIGCEILRSKYKIPKPILNLDSHLIQSVSTVDGSIIYSETSWEGKKFSKGKKYTSNKPDYWIRDEYLFLEQKIGPKVVSITGLFFDPDVKKLFETFCGGAEPDCTGILDREFPIDDDLIEPLVRLVAEEAVNLFSSRQPDIQNDGQDPNVEQN